MTRFGKCFLAIAAIIAGVAVCAPAPDASDAHFAVVNNNDYYFPSYGHIYGTVLKLAGPKNSPSLKVAASLDTGTMAQEGGGGDTCSADRAPQL